MYPCSVFREVPAARRPRQLPQLLVVVRSAANNRTQLQFQSGEQLAPAPPAARAIPSSSQHQDTADTGLAPRLLAPAS